MGDTELQVVSEKPPEMAISVIKARVDSIGAIYRQVMQKDHDYGVVPGCGDKPTLLKSGAEKILTAFRVSPTYKIEKTDLPNLHREISCTVSLTAQDGTPLGEGVGCCSTMESKYRYRGTGGKVCPKCGTLALKASKKEYGGGYWCDSKLSGCGWSAKGATPEAKEIDKLPSTKIENPDLADQYNTILKMAKKRALVDAVNTCMGASSVFDQDLEDLNIDEPGRPPVEMPRPLPAPVKVTPEAKAEYEAAKAQVAPAQAPIDPNKITKPQRDRLFAIAKGVPEARIKEVVKGFGFNSTKDITKAEYENICIVLQHDAEEIAKAKNEQPPL